MYFKKIFIILSIIFTTSSFPGIILLSEVPEGIKQLIQKEQLIAQQDVDMCKTDETNFLFEKSKYDPHMTLAYVCHDEFDMPTFAKNNPALIHGLAQIAQNNHPITISSHINDAELVVWPGKWEREYNDKKFKNYSILAIKLKPSAQLLVFIEKIDTFLAQMPNSTKREFPFSAHVTIGWIYDQNDNDTSSMVNELKPKLEKAIREDRTESQDFSIDSFKLSTHDKKQIIFSFKK